MFVAFVFDVHLGMTALQMDLDQEYCMNALIGREMLILWCFSLIECALGNVDNLKMNYNALCCIWFYPPVFNQGLMVLAIFTAVAATSECLKKKTFCHNFFLFQVTVSAWKKNNLSYICVCSR